MQATTENHALNGAVHWLQQITEWMSDTDAHDDAICESPLSIDVKSDWTPVGRELEPSEFQILLSYGGPACRIHGLIDVDGDPVEVTIEYQDWGTPWTSLDTTEVQESILNQFASRFIFQS